MKEALVTKEIDERVFDIEFKYINEQAKRFAENCIKKEIYKTFRRHNMVEYKHIYCEILDHLLSFTRKVDQDTRTKDDSIKELSIISFYLILMKSG